MANLKRPGNGGPGRGGGRKSKTYEEKVRKYALAAIVKKWGSLEGGLEALLDSHEPVLMRFVFEHAFGKPKEQIEKKVEHNHNLRIGYGDRNDESESCDDFIQDAEIVEPDDDVRQNIELPGNEY